MIVEAADLLHPAARAVPQVVKDEVALMLDRLEAERFADAGVYFRRFDPAIVEAELLARLKVSVGVRGRIRLSKLNAQRQVVRETDWFHNLFTDVGLDKIGTGDAFGSFLRIGTGTATPANSDTQLQAQAAWTTSFAAGAPATLTNAGSPNYETTSETTWEFAMGSLNGNYAEIGLGWSASTASTLATRALIVDNMGVPTAFAVSSLEILQVTYQVITYPQTTDSTGTVTIAGVAYNYVSRNRSIASARATHPNADWLRALVTCSAYDGALGTNLAAGPSGTTTSLTAGAMGTYTPGSKTRSFALSAGISVGNLAGGIRSITTEINAYGGSVLPTQTSFAKVSDGTTIPKDNTMTLSMSWSFSWDRH